MTLQAILTSLKQFHGRRQPAYLHPGLALHTTLTQPFCSAKQIPPAHLESLYISNMSDSFVEACPGDILSTKVVIADDKSTGSFRHVNRPKLPAMIEPWWDDPKYQALYNRFADERGVRRLPFQGDVLVHDNMQTSETIRSIDSVIDVKMVAALEAVLLADVTSPNQPDTDIASWLTESPAPPSISWISFDDFGLSDGFEDVDISTTDTASSIRILDVVNKASPFTGGVSKEVASVPVIHAVAFDPEVLLRMGQEFSDVKIMEPRAVSVRIITPVITESDALALMGFGRLAASKIEPELEVVSPIAQPINTVKKTAAAVTPTPPTPPSTWDSFRKYLRAEGKKMAMCAIKGEPFPEMPDTPPRFKKPVSTIVPAPFVSLSSSGSLRKYLREEGKNITMHALSGEPYPDMPETPPRFKKRMVGTVIPSFAYDPFLVANPDAFRNLADSRQISSSLFYPAAKDIFGPGESPIRTDLLTDDDLVIIDPMFSKVFNFPRTSSICRVVNTVKRLSRRGSNKENVSSPTPTSTKASRTPISSFAPIRLLSHQKSRPLWR